ncbi:MAG: 3-deoxy-7-phosphoheptulonate synthase, partial [Gammaproteobacteria bacterium]|nr:3-deoxy-7-phosphoheptulonate synthase [Gammaproteobacteria bacterium]
MSTTTDDLRIRRTNQLISPEQLIGDIAVTDRAAATVANARQAIHNILAGEDDRLLVVVGPCSIHDPAAAREYAGLLKAAADRLSKDLFVVMRVYFEKPRTTVGWKGLINDPKLDGSFNINEGLRVARQLLLELNGLGVPVGCEFLDMITPQYIA